jgi:hypothetical protein
MPSHSEGSSSLPCLRCQQRLRLRILVAVLVLQSVLYPVLHLVEQQHPIRNPSSLFGGTRPGDSCEVGNAARRNASENMPTCFFDAAAVARALDLKPVARPIIEIAAIRRHLGFTQEQPATVPKVNPRTIQNWEARAGLRQLEKRAADIAEFVDIINDYVRRDKQSDWLRSSQRSIRRTESTRIPDGWKSAGRHRRVSASAGRSADVRLTCKQRALLDTWAAGATPLSGTFFRAVEFRWMHPDDVMSAR